MENSFGARTTHLYNADGQVSASVNPLGARSSQVYDAAGRPVARINPLGARVTSLFDAAGQMVAMVSPLGFRTTFSFDAVGRQVVTIDANEHSSTALYDAANRDIASENALGHRTTNILDVAGTLRAVQDARGNLWSFTYDVTGMRTQQIDPLGRITTSGYDPAGQQVLRIDARGNPTTYSFDPVGQLTRRWYPDDTRATFLFDAVGNRTGMRDTTGLSTYTFDALNQFASVNQSSVGIITYSFDALGRRRSMIAPTGGYFTYAYDPANRLAWMSNPEGDRTTFSYDMADRRTLKELANGTRASFSYDAADQVHQLFNLRSDDSLISGFTYEIDAAGNRTNVLQATGDRVTWTYDRNNQLTSEHRSGADAYFHTFVYDPVGNRLLSLEDGAATTYTYDVANQIQTSTDAIGQTDYLFDANGNQQIVVEPSGDRTTSIWDYENQPSVIELSSGGPLTVIYNADLRRVLLAGPNLGVTQFVWDRGNDAYLLEDNDTEPQSTVWTNEPVHFGRVLSMSDNGVQAYYHLDGQRSVAALTDIQGQTVASYVYSAFGTTMSSTGSSDNVLRFHGADGSHFDEFNGHYYVRARYYSPEAARWTSIDPLILMHALRPSSLYIYSHNSPTSASDPSGLLPRRTTVALRMPPFASSTYTPPILQFTGPIELGRCGAFSWIATFWRKAPLPNEPRFFVQKADLQMRIHYCCHPFPDITHRHDIARWLTHPPHRNQFWEGIDYAPPRINIVRHFDPGTFHFIGADVFAFSGGGNCSFGFLEMLGTYREARGEIPHDWVPGGHPLSRDLPSTETEPNLDYAWPDRDVLAPPRRMIRVVWDCCGPDCCGDAM